MPWLHVIAAGSMLESLIHRQINFPVGRVEYMPVRPCSFMEFLSAVEDQQSVDLVNRMPFPDFGHEHLLRQFMVYTFVGGMPEVIEFYRKEKSLARLNPIYDALVTSYLDDVEKYARNQTMSKVLRHTIQHSFSHASKRITFQGFGDSHYKNREMSEAFRTLEKAFLLQLVYPVTNCEKPAMPNIRRSPKLQMFDTGMVNYMAGLQNELIDFEVINRSFAGQIAEHITGQELLCFSDSVLFRLNYWTRENKNATSEVDFIWPYGNQLIPVEVKAGKAGKLRSLHQFIDRAPHALAVRVYSGRLSLEKTRTISGKEFSLLNLPFYLINKLPEYVRLMQEDSNFTGLSPEK